MACPGTWLCNWHTGSDWRLTWHGEAIEVKTDRIGGLWQTAPLVICAGARAAAPLMSPAMLWQPTALHSTRLLKTSFSSFFSPYRIPGLLLLHQLLCFLVRAKIWGFFYIYNSIWKQILSYKVKTKICISDISTNSRSLSKQTCDIGHGIDKPCIRTFCNSLTCFFH